MKRVRDFFMPDEVEISSRESIIRTSLRKLIFYLVFITLGTTIAFGKSNNLGYVFTSILKNEFIYAQFPTIRDNYITFNEITTAPDFWHFLETIITDNLYNEFWYSSKNPIKRTEIDDRNILFENKLLGLPRLRQLRVKNDSCIIHQTLKRSFYSCYGPFNTKNEDSKPFGPPNNRTKWHFTAPEDFDNRLYSGRVSTYHSGGFKVLLGKTSNETAITVAELKHNFWITRHTRVVFLDFTVYNANINLFCVIKLTFEFPPTGGIVTSSSFHSVKLFSYVMKFDFVVLALEIVYVFFIIYYAIEECIEMFMHRLNYFKSFWNYMDLLIVIISIGCIGYLVHRRFIMSDAIKILEENPQTYLKFDTVGFMQLQVNNAIAVTLFFIWIKIFKYINVSRTMGQLSTTLSHCSLDIFGFSIMFFVVFFAFAQVGYLLFGTQVEDFSTFGKSVLTLLMTILGDFDYEEIEKTNKFLAPVFFITYIFFVFFVLFNMFLAIIMDTYSGVKADIQRKCTELSVKEFLERGPRKIYHRLRPAAANKQTTSTTDAIWRLQKILKMCGFPEVEIKMFFAKYGIEEEAGIDDERVKQFRKELKERIKKDRKMLPMLPDIQSSRAVTNETFKSFRELVDKLSGDLEEVDTKVEALIKMRKFQEQRVQ